MALAVVVLVGASLIGAACWVLLRGTSPIAATPPDPVLAAEVDRAPTAIPPPPPVPAPESDCGATEPVVVASGPAAAVSICRDGARLVYTATPHASALMLPQSDTERLLEAHLAGLGVQVERRTELTAFTDRGTHVEADLRHADGGVERVDTPWLVGCDGAHSSVRHGLGMHFDGQTRTNDWVLADVHVHGGGLPASELALHWHADGMVIFFPISASRWRVVADIGASQGDTPATPTLEQVQALVDRRGPGGLVLADAVWLSAFRINERKVRDYRAGRVFLAGDAAHVHSPAGGQGMNTGMQDAINLAWKLALVWRSRAAAELLLSSYSAERSAVGDAVIRNASRLTSIALASHPVLQGLRNHVAGFLFGLGRVQHAMADTLEELSIGYPHSPLNGPHADTGPAAGSRIEPVAGQAPIGAGDTPRFALFAAADDATNALLRDHADLLESDLRPPLADGHLALARPDGYVAVSSRHADAIGAWLKRIKAGPT